MKKILFFMAVVTSLILVSCSDEPFTPNGQMLNDGNLTITVDESAPAKGITVGASQVVTALIELIDPAQSIQSATWNVGGPSVFIFNAALTGTYWIRVTETDQSNSVTSYSNSFAFNAGYNYYVNITLGGRVIVTVGTNGITNTTTNTNTTNTNTTNTNTTNTNVLPPAGGATFGIFSETVSNVVVFDTDTKIDIWNGMTMADDTTTAGDGTKSWKFVGTAPTAGGWMGMGVRVEPVDSYRNLYAFRNGSYRFMFKGTRGFKIGLKSGLGSEAWLTPAQLAPYGLVTNNTWCTVSIPVSAFAGLNTAEMAQYFMFVADASTGYANGAVYNFDNIYFTTNATPVAGVSTFGLYTETYPVNVTWDTDGKMDIWNGFAMSSDTTNFGDGTMSLKITAASSTWGGMGMRIEPLASYKDLSAFVGGNLKFMFKSSKNFTKVGVKDYHGTEAWVTGSACISSYGMRTDNTWCTVTIPMTAFTAIDWAQIQQYFMFVADGANYTTGNVWNIDNIYFAK